MKTKRRSQYANKHGSDSARFEHGGGSRSDTKGEYVVLACQKHYTDVASPVQKLWRENQANKPIANEHSLPRPDSARFEHGGGSRSNTKGEYVVLVCQKHYLPT